MPAIKFNQGEIEASKPLPVDWYRMELVGYTAKLAKSGESTNHKFKVKLLDKADRIFTFFINDTNPEYGLIPLCSALLGRAVTPDDEVDFDKACARDGQPGRTFEGHVVGQLDQNGAMRQVCDAFRPDSRR